MLNLHNIPYSNPYTPLQRNPKPYSIGNYLGPYSKYAAQPDASRLSALRLAASSALLASGIGPHLGT